MLTPALVDQTQQSLKGVTSIQLPLSDGYNAICPTQLLSLFANLFSFLVSSPSLSVLAQHSRVMMVLFWPDELDFCDDPHIYFGFSLLCSKIMLCYMLQC